VKGCPRSDAQCESIHVSDYRIKKIFTLAALRQMSTSGRPFEQQKGGA
jgi:hypothetical protein